MDLKTSTKIDGGGTGEIKQGVSRGPPRKILCLDQCSKGFILGNYRGVPETPIYDLRKSR